MMISGERRAEEKCEARFHAALKESRTRCGSRSGRDAGRRAGSVVSAGMKRLSTMATEDKAKVATGKRERVGQENNLPVTVMAVMSHD